jgi:iron complex outermembrane receptor protein
MNVRRKLRMGRVAFVVGLRSAMARFIFLSNAFAQESAPPPSQLEIERVIVTGSNIPTAQEESSLPVTRYTADWLKKSGANAPVEGLRQLPSFVGNASTENNSNGGTGAATVNLRALGSENVLILINGRRAFLGSGFDGMDVNLIPLSGPSTCGGAEGWRLIYLRLGRSRRRGQFYLVE